MYEKCYVVMWSDQCDHTSGIINIFRNFYDAVLEQERQQFIMGVGIDVYIQEQLLK